MLNMAVNMIRQRAKEVRILSRLFTKHRKSALSVVTFCTSSVTLKQLDLKQDPATFSHKFLIQQASSVVASAASQLLTQSVVALVDTVDKYRASVLELIQLLDTREQIKEGDVADGLSELITGCRLKANELKSQLMELQGFMEYVERLVVTATETSFLAGAEICANSLSERLLSAQLQVKDSLKHLQDLENDLIHLQKRIILETE